MSDEESVASARASVLFYDRLTKKWNPKDGAGGLSKVHIYHQRGNNRFRIVGRMMTGSQEWIINQNIEKGFRYFKASPMFHQWKDSTSLIYGLNFSSKEDADTFGLAMERVLDILGHSSMYTNNSQYSKPSSQPLYQTIGHSHSSVDVDKYAKYCKNLIAPETDKMNNYTRLCNSKKSYEDNYDDETASMLCDSDSEKSDWHGNFSRPKREIYPPLSEDELLPLPEPQHLHRNWHKAPKREIYGPLPDDESQHLHNDKSYGQNFTIAPLHTPDPCPKMNRIPRHHSYSETHVPQHYAQPGSIADMMTPSRDNQVYRSSSDTLSPDMSSHSAPPPRPSAESVYGTANHSPTLNQPSNVVSAVATLPRLHLRMNPEEEMTETSLAAALASAKLRKTPTKVEPAANDTRHSKASTPMIEEITEILAKRRARANSCADSESSSSSESQRTQITVKPKPSASKLNSNNNSPDPSYKSNQNSSATTESVHKGGRVVLEGDQIVQLRQDLLNEIRTEMRKAKDEIINTIRQMNRR